MDDLERAARITLVTNAISCLAQAADFGTLEEYGALLAEDLVWEFPGGTGSGLAAQVRRGREDALAGARERRESGVQGPGTGTMHVITNASVVPGDGEATSMAYWHFVTGVGGTPAVRSSGIYRDRFVHTADGWQLAHRRISVG
ncbi:MAG TPA: nuclear transport factor 2 family protein [Rhodococcus sp. (in: high G+C Gram-positive bacteria)]|nr:nuclear transport factor 2 family protein [Rhodococcus sp. (in: high G+C Gram-positive bacteria)]